MGKNQEAIEECQQAVEDSHKYRSDYKLVGRAWQRMGNAYVKLEDFDNAIKAYNKSLTENRDAGVLTLLNKTEKMKKDKQIADYLSPEKSTEAKNEGNEHFKAGRIAEAIKCYEEAIRRNPKDSALYSNRAACYMKFGEYPTAIKDCDLALELDPKFVKALTRKAHCQFYMKDYHKSLSSYEEGLKLDPENSELREGLNRTVDCINRQHSGGGETDPDALKKAMSDPEIQEILSDPVMQQILNDMQKNPGAAAEHLKNPMIKQKIQKLMAAGVLSVK